MVDNFKNRVKVKEETQKVPFIPEKTTISL